MRRALFAVVLLFGGCAQSQAPQQPITVVSQDQIWPGPTRVEARELDRANEAFSAAWLAADIEALLDAYTPDAIVHPPAGGVLMTSDQIRNVWAPIVNQQREVHRLEPTLRRRLGDDRVLEMGRWYAARTVDNQLSSQSGCYTVIWRNQAGRWRMEYDAWGAPNEASWACRPR